MPVISVHIPSTVLFEQYNECELQVTLSFCLTDVMDGSNVDSAYIPGHTVFQLLQS